MSDIKNEEKLTVMIHTDFALTLSGFGKNCRNIFEYLYKIGKYNLINFAVGTVDVQLGDQNGRTPWKTIASVSAQNLDNIKKQNDPKQWENIDRMAGYGAFELDAVVRKEKPDVFIAIQDIWGIDFAVDKSWFNKIPCALWTTLDSLPILQKAVDIAPKVKHYWSWADFATKALHKLGHTHVKTVRGSLNCENFYRLENHQRKELRKRFGISDKTFVIGDVFRNQLRKSVPNMLQGFKMFKDMNPKLDTKLLFHTNWAEGWDIRKLMQEVGVSQEDVLTTYVCKHCRFFHVRPFTTNEENCPNCHSQKTFTTTHPSIGVDEKGLNEIYNLMDVFLHAITSGGQELPVQEIKLVEVITLMTNYSCGEDNCVPEAGSLPLEWSEYREPSTAFIKSSTFPSSIAKQLNKVLNMEESDRREMGRKARKWVLENFSVEIIGKFLENWIDSNAIKNPNPGFIVKDFKEDSEWVKGAARGFIGRELTKEELSDVDELK